MMGVYGAELGISCFWDFYFIAVILISWFYDNLHFNMLSSIICLPLDSIGFIIKAMKPKKINLNSTIVYRYMYKD